jgi:TetR/AcrR family transcriptional repressor of nem operon
MKQEPSDSRQRILATGESLISGKGFSAVGLAEILSAAGVPKGSFYHYFESKEQFGEALLEGYFADYLKRLDALFHAQTLTVPERLMRYWQHWVEVQSLESDPRQCLVVKLSAEVSDLSEAMRKALWKGTDAVLAGLEACLAEGTADGSLPSVLDPRSTALTLYQLWLGASLLAKVRRDPSPFDTAMEATRLWLSLTTSKST